MCTISYSCQIVLGNKYCLMWGFLACTLSYTSLASFELWSYYIMNIIIWNLCLMHNWLILPSSQNSSRLALDFYVHIHMDNYEPRHIYRTHTLIIIVWISKKVKWILIWDGWSSSEVIGAGSLHFDCSIDYFWK